MRNLALSLALLFALTFPFVRAQEPVRFAAEVPTWIDTVLHEDASARPLIGRARWPSARTSTTRRVRFGTGTPAQGEVYGSRHGGTLALTTKSSAMGSLALPIDAVFDLRRADLSGMGMALGDESILVAARRADGLAQIFAIARDSTDSILRSEIHALPVVGHPGEIFLRVGAWGGRIYVLEANTGKFLAFGDSDGDQIPDQRLHDLFAFRPGGGIPYVPGLYPPAAGDEHAILVTSWLAPTPIERRSLLIGLYRVRRGDLRYGAVERGKLRGEIDRVILDKLVPGLVDLRVGGKPGDEIAIEVSSSVAQDLAFEPWGARMQLKAGAFDALVQGPGPLLPGTIVRAMANGTEFARETVPSNREVVVRSWPEITRGQPGRLQVEGANLDLVQSVRLRWLRPDALGRVVVEERMVPVAILPRRTPQSIWLACEAIPRHPGQLRMQLLDSRGRMLNYSKRMNWMP